VIYFFARLFLFNVLRFAPRFDPFVDRKPAGCDFVEACCQGNSREKETGIRRPGAPGDEHLAQQHIRIQGGKG
jgi:hypothetical protein